MASGRLVMVTPLGEAKAEGASDFPFDNNGGSIRIVERAGSGERRGGPARSAAQAAASFWMRGWFSSAHRTVFGGRPSRVSSWSVTPSYRPPPISRVRVFRCSAMCGIRGQGAVHVGLVPGFHVLRDVGDLASQHGRVVLREPVHVLQLRAGEFVGLRDVRRRVDEDLHAQLRHVVTRRWARAAGGRRAGAVHRCSAAPAPARSGGGSRRRWPPAR